jgi:hypothetical protein
MLASAPPAWASWHGKPAAGRPGPAGLRPPRSSGRQGSRQGTPKAPKQRNECEPNVRYAAIASPAEVRRQHVLSCLTSPHRRSAPSRNRNERSAGGAAGALPGGGYPGAARSDRLGSGSPCPPSDVVLLLSLVDQRLTWAMGRANLAWRPGRRRGRRLPLCMRRMRCVVVRSWGPAPQRP